MRKRPPDESVAATPLRALDQVLAVPMDGGPFGAGFTELYNRIVATVAAACKRRGAGVDEATELGHDAAAEVWAKRNSTLAGYSVPRILAWARGVGRNAFLNRRRQAAAVDAFPEDDDPAVVVATTGDPEVALLRSEVKGIIEAEAATWSEQRRDVVRLKRQGLKYAEIASCLGISIHTVHRHWVTASKRFGIVLADYDLSKPDAPPTAGHQRRVS